MARNPSTRPSFPMAKGEGEFPTPKTVLTTPTVDIFRLLK